MSLLRHKNLSFKKGYAIAIALAVTIAGCGAAKYDTPAPSSSLVLSANDNQSVLTKGTIFMKRKTVYVPPKQEKLEDKIRRVVQTSIAENDPIEDAIRNIVKQTVAEDEEVIGSKIRKIAKQEVLSSDDYISEVASRDNLTKQDVEQMAQKIFVDATPKIRSIAENTVLNASPQIKAFAKEAVLDSKDYIQLVAANNLKNSEDYIANIASRNNLTSNQVKQVAREVFNSSKPQMVATAQQVVRNSEDYIAEIAKRNNLTKEQVKAVAENTVLNASPQIKAFAKEAVLDSKDYIQLVAANNLKNSEEYISSVARKTNPTNEDIKKVAKGVLVSSKDDMKLMIQKEITNSDDYIRGVAKEALAEFKAPTDDFAIKAIVKQALEEERRVASLDTSIASLKGLTTPQGNVIDIIPTSKKFVDPSSWIQLKDYNVVVHEDNTKLRNIMKNIMTKAEPFVGPWQVKWKLKRENSDVVNERFSLDAETTFASFADYISDFLRKYRGFPIEFKIFEEERILVITD